jgi:hypothetical protein
LPCLCDRPVYQIGYVVNAPLTFYTTIDADSVRDYMPATPVLIPASSWHRRYGTLKTTPLPEHVTERAGDPGGFVFTLRQKRDYPFSDGELAEWGEAMQLSWCATKDYCCEPEITAGQGSVAERQQRTTEAAWRIWQAHSAAPFAWVPTIQGWEVEDYARHACELRSLIDEMRAHYGDDLRWRVGIGTLCRRASPKMIRRVIAAVLNELGPTPIHLWGVKLDVLKSRVALPDGVVSVDSAAWNGRFGTGIECSRGSGLSQREYSYLVAHPEYVAKVEKALDAPKQMEIPL